MPTIFLTLVAVLAVTLTLLLSGRARPNPRAAGFGLVTAGFGLIAFAIVAAVVVGWPLAVAEAAAGLVMIAAGVVRLRAVG